MGEHDWNDLEGLSRAGSLDRFLAGNTSVSQSLVASFSEEDSSERYPAGTRVAFVGDLSSLLSYSDPPGVRELGTVVRVRTAMGDVTAYDGKVFVKWDSGRFFPVYAPHLVPSSSSRQAGSVSLRVSSIGDLTSFMKSASGDDDLVHKATRDLWKLSKQDGAYVIERLFDETGKPLKV